jgi:SPP1 gp7 family putative phage head morphogenesis protein
MDNDKKRSWYDSIVPWFVKPDERDKSPKPQKTSVTDDETTSTKVQEVTVIRNNVKVGTIERGTVDITKWRNGIIEAEDYNQNREKLFHLYEDVMLDATVKSVIRKRISQVTNKKLVFIKKNGEEDEALTALAQTSYFETLQEEIINAEFWGHSLIELFWPPPGSDLKGETLIIPRANVKPRYGIVCERSYDMDGVDYRRKPFMDRLIEVGSDEDLGLLASAAQYAIYKRGNMGDWAEFATVFGIPFRYATYNNEQSRVAIESGLEQAGSSGYLVMPEGAELKFLSGNASGQGQEIFKSMWQATNQEITILFLGNSMSTIESSAGGYAQSKTQQTGEDEVIASDRRKSVRVINEQLLTYLASIGYATEGGGYQYVQEDRLSLAQRIDIDVKLSQVIDMDPDYFYEKYGVPKPSPEVVAELERKRAEEKPEPEPPGEKAPKDDDKPAPGKPKAQLSHQGGTSRAKLLAAHYADDASCPACINLMDELPVVKFVRIPRKLQDSIAAAVRTGKLTGDNISGELHRHYYKRFAEVVKVGFTRDLNPSNDFPDFELTQSMKRNLSAFAAAKHSALVEQLTTLRGLPKGEYNKAARKLMDVFNDRYLRTELQTLEFAAHSAGQWRNFEERAEFYPNLQYTTAADDRVRPTHAKLDGATYPLNDPFWDTHMPPLGWRCRCTVIQTDGPLQSAENAPPVAGFGNPGKTRKLVQDDHPYFSLSGDRLGALLEVAETLRAAIELKNVKKRARTQVQRELEIPGVGPLNMTSDQVDALLATESLSLATRNALIAEMELALKNASLESYMKSLGIALMKVEVGEQTFDISALVRGEGWRITKVELKR